MGVCSVDGKKYQGADSDIVTAKIGTPQIGDVYSVGDLKYKVTGAKAFYQCTSIKVLKINGSALEYVGKKGLAVNKLVTLRLLKKVYTKYKKLIKSSGVYSKTKFVKY